MLGARKNGASPRTQHNTHTLLEMSRHRLVAKIGEQASEQRTEVDDTADCMCVVATAGQIKWVSPAHAPFCESDIEYRLHAQFAIIRPQVLVLYVNFRWKIPLHLIIMNTSSCNKPQCWLLHCSDVFDSFRRFSR